ncbi:uncharacterized protein LOC131947924 [Physella acuta]|uniref:uncharacterized protein LOC131947924 n=1 Tax=Physella acuta TaxID=109671 RepID=UPI0027DE5955|nr:uncharacterized protein LOC131947924 [Physella acuta]
MTMIISNVNCSDEGNYHCIVHNLFSTGSNQTQALYIKVPPKLPVLTSVPRTVIEGSSINVTCKANLGRPGKGTIRWEFYSNGLEANISTQITSRNLTLLPEDDPCTRRWESRISLVANRTFQNLSLACYVVNTDFPVTQPGCSSVNFCSRTDNITIMSGDIIGIIVGIVVGLVVVVAVLVVVCLWFKNKASRPSGRTQNATIGSSMVNAPRRMYENVNNNKSPSVMTTVNYVNLAGNAGGANHYDVPETETENVYVEVDDTAEETPVYEGTFFITQNSSVLTE